MRVAVAKLDTGRGVECRGRKEEGDVDVHGQRDLDANAVRVGNKDVDNLCKEASLGIAFLLWIVFIFERE